MYMYTHTLKVHIWEGSWEGGRYTRNEFILVSREEDFKDLI